MRLSHLAIFFDDSFFIGFKFYLFVEFKDASSLIRLKSIVSQFPNLRRVPLESHFLYYRSASSRFDHRIPRVVACDLDENRLTDDDLLTCSTVSTCIYNICQISVFEGLVVLSAFHLS